MTPTHFFSKIRHQQRCHRVSLAEYWIFKEMTARMTIMQLCNAICLSSSKYSEYQYNNRVQNSQIFERMSKEKTLKKELGILAGIRNCEK